MFPEKILQSTPHKPGVYLMLDAKARVIYVGKAKDLVKRLTSYTRHSSSEHNKTTVMLKKVEQVKTIITTTEKEALILEASLIKKHKPRYNIILRDDKNYPYIAVTVGEEWPRVMMVRRKRRDNSRYFGPYSSATAMWATLKLIASLFPLRNCRGEKLRPRTRPCLNRQIGKCLAPCTGNVSRKIYMENVDKILLLLQGKSRDLLAELKRQMLQASERLNFEQAGQFRDQIRALKTTLEKQLVAAGHGKNQDVFGYVRSGTTVAVNILFVRDGLVSGSRSFFIEDYFGLDSQVLSQTISQYYDRETPPPKEILLPFSPENFELLSEYLADFTTHILQIKIPQRGDSTILVEMANTNARQLFAEKEKKERSWQSLGKSIKEKLQLSRTPETIECLDISNISGQHAIGSLVCFSGGEANKSRFRHYKIRTIEGPDDYGMMREVMERRFKRGIKEGNLPNLFVVDGGKGQLGMAMAVARELGITNELDWIGIAKERHEEGEKLYKPGRKNPILLPAHSPVLLYLMRIRDESHRYGITFHRKLRNRATLSSELDEIEGIGDNRKKLLLKKIGSLKKIKEASLQKLQEVEGIGPLLAKKIYTSLQRDKNKS
ncbi:excinuclease ABC subunit UvrC [Desulfotalea psychrophila]|nr:excinuclease ABC subunit UvrC [Desulfotalea psychrophila]